MTHFKTLLLDSKRDQVYIRVRIESGGQVLKQVSNQVWRQGRDQVLGQAYDQVWEQVREDLQ